MFAGAAHAQQPPEWTRSIAPHRVVGNVYYVGSQELAAYLVTTPQGHILINSTLEANVPLIRKSVETLGFRFSDIKVLLISHAHFDHCAGSAAIKKATGAQYMVMDADAPEVEVGGKGNFAFGDDPKFLYPPAKVDRVLHDADEVRLGDTVLVAHLTAGHTKGTTTWTMKAREGEKTYDVVIVGGPNVLSDYKLVNNPLYPQIADDFARTFRLLKSLPCDVFLGAHGSYYGMEAKAARIKDGAPNSFIDPGGYKAYVAEREQAFLEALARQKAGPE
jgi:metallo-beta-lactamase class B